MFKKLVYISIVSIIATTGVCAFGQSPASVDNLGISGHNRDSIKKKPSNMLIDSNDFVITPLKFPYKYYTSEDRTKFGNYI